jgi:hypothetical protein
MLLLVSFDQSRFKVVALCSGLLMAKRFLRERLFRLVVGVLVAAAIVILADLVDEALSIVGRLPA